MRKLLKHISSVFAVAVLGFSMIACDDWTEPESISADFGTISSADPSAYAKYLANLRAYRNRPHKKIYVWFDNTDKAMASQGERITALPDSIDVIVLTSPTSITNQMVDEIKKVQTEKGMEVLISVGFNEIKADYTALCESLADQRLAWMGNPANEGLEMPTDLQDPTFANFVGEAFTKNMSYLKVGVNGIMAGFDGKSTLHLTPSELAEYNAQANVYLGSLSDFYERNNTLLMDFIGKPQNIKDFPVLSKFRTVFMSEALEAQDAKMYTLYYNDAQGIVEDSQLGMVCNYRAVSLDDDAKTGFMSDGSLALEALASWTAAHNVGAAGVRNVRNDYFVSNGTYDAIRQFIQTINPAAK